MVRSKNEVLEWYRQADAVTRIEFVCDLLNMCFPCELRLIGLCAEELGRRDSHPLKSHELRANNPAELQSIRDLSDAHSRGRLAIYLCLLRPSNKTCSGSLFDLLLASSAELLASGGARPLQVQPRPQPLLGDRLVLDDLLLLVTIAIHHPAFSVAQKYALVERLEALKDLLADLDSRFVGCKPADVSLSTSRSAGREGKEAGAAGSCSRDVAEMATATAAAADHTTRGASSCSDKDSMTLAPAGRLTPPSTGAVQILNGAGCGSGSDRAADGTERSAIAGSGCHHIATVPPSEGKTDSDPSGLLPPPADCDAADATATFRAPSSSCSSGCSSSSETKRPLPLASYRSRMASTKTRSAVPVDTSSSSPDRDSPASAPRLVGHQGHRHESGGTRQSRRTSRTACHRSQSPAGAGVRPSLFTPAMAHADDELATACVEPLPAAVKAHRSRDSSSSGGDGRVCSGDSDELWLPDKEPACVGPHAGCPATAAGGATVTTREPQLLLSRAASAVGAAELRVDDDRAAPAGPSDASSAEADLGPGERTELVATAAPTDAWDCDAAAEPAETDLAAAQGGQLLLATTGARASTSAGLVLPLCEASLASSETLSDPVALSPTTELATSTSSGGEEHTFSSDSCLHAGPTVASDSCGGDYCGRTGSAAQMMAAAPLPLPPQAGYAMAAARGSAGFMPGYGGIVYCCPVPVYFGPSAARRPRRGGGSGGGSASAGHDLYYQHCVQPCVVMHAPPMPVYCAPPPPLQPGVEMAGECGGAGAPLHGSGLPWTAATAACPRRAEFCYTCGYSGHTGAQCPSLQQQP